MQSAGIVLKSLLVAARCCATRTLTRFCPRQHGGSSRSWGRFRTLRQQGWVLYWRNHCVGRNLAQQACKQACSVMGRPQTTAVSGGRWLDYWPSWPPIEGWLSVPGEIGPCPAGARAAGGRGSHTSCTDGRREGTADWAQTCPGLKGSGNAPIQNARDQAKHGVRGNSSQNDTAISPGRRSSPDARDRGLARPLGTPEPQAAAAGSGLSGRAGS